MPLRSMKRPATSQSGLLLVEAVLSAVVIAVGLVSISRSLTGPLRALRRMQETERLLSVAEATLAELEQRGLLQQPFPSQPEGTVEEAQWSIERKDVPLGFERAGELLGTRVTLTVKLSDATASSPVRVIAIWPARWIPSQWSSAGK